MVFIFTQTAGMRVTATLTLLALLVAGCGGSGPEEKQGQRQEIVTTAYPIAWLVRQVAGDDADVVDLVKPGAEAHDLELSPRQVATVTGASTVVFLKGFQPAVDEALAEGYQGFDLTPAVDKRGEDPHFWLDPLRMADAAVAVADHLAERDPERADDYQDRAAAVGTRLRELHQGFRSRLSGCERRELVTSHDAFGYLAQRYDLVPHPISGLSPDAEPTPARMAEVARFARRLGVTTIFFETLVDPKVAQTLAREVGASAAVLDPVEGVAKGDDYLTVQTRNAAALQKALGCR